MLSTPPAITTSIAPDITACAAKCSACCEEPHWRSIVVAGTLSGSDEASTALRATFIACWPICTTQPRITSSTAPGGAPERATTSSITRAARSAGCQPASLPPFRPPAVRGATTIDRQCGSSQQALHFAAQAVMSGAMDVVIAGGVESMSRVPITLSTALPAQHGYGVYTSPRMAARYPGVEFSQFTGAEAIARTYGLSREELDVYSYESHRKAAAATRAGWFADEILALDVELPDGTLVAHAVDEGIRFDASLDAIRAVKLLRPGGRVTAASSSQICDGASACMIANECGLALLGAAPLARIHHLSVLGHDPVVMLEAPIPATERALVRDHARRRAVADLARARRGDTAARPQQLDRADRVQARIEADPLVAHAVDEGPVGQLDVECEDLVGEPAGPRRRGRFAVALVAVHVELFAREAVRARDRLGARELAELNARVARCHARARVHAVAVLRGQRRRKGDRDAAHAFDAARDHHVHRARHHRLRREVQRLLRGTALAVDRRRGNALGERRGEYGVARDVHRLLADLHDAAQNHVVDRARRGGVADLRAERAALRSTRCRRSTRARRRGRDRTRADRRCRPIGAAA